MQGHIHKRVRTDRHGKETVRWYVVIDRGFDHEGRRRQKWHGGFRTRREAEAVRAKLVTDVNTGSYVAPGRTTLGEWISDSWLPMTEPRVKPSTFFSYKRNLEIHVLPALGAKLLQQLTPPMLNVLYASLATGSETRKAAEREDDQLHPLDAAQGARGRSRRWTARQERGRRCEAAAAGAARDRRHQRVGAARARAVPRGRYGDTARADLAPLGHDRNAARGGARPPVAGRRPGSGTPVRQTSARRGRL